MSKITLKIILKLNFKKYNFKFNKIAKKVDKNI